MSRSPEPRDTSEPGVSARDASARGVSDRDVSRRDVGERSTAGPYRGLAVTVSQRASTGVYADRGGPLLVEALRAWGFTADGPRVVPDGEPVEAVLRQAVAAGYDVVLTTGGTGISPTDRTPEMTRRVLDREVPGIPEAIRAAGLAKVPTAALSRGVAGVAGGTLVVNLPGSTGGVRDGLAVLADLLRHAVDQIRGGDHPREDTGSPGAPGTGPAAGSSTAGNSVAGSSVAESPGTGSPGSGSRAESPPSVDPPRTGPSGGDTGASPHGASEGRHPR